MIKIASIWGFDVDKLLEEIKQTNITHVVLDFLNEVNYKINHPAYDELFEIAYKNNIHVTILTPYPRELPKLLDLSQDRFNNVDIIHWETYWFNRTYSVWKPHDSLNRQKNLEMFNLRNGESLTDFRFPYITLNNISKQHRCLVMDLLAKYNLIDKGAISWRDIRRDCDEIRHTFSTDMTDSLYRNYPYKYWKPKRLILDQNINDVFLQETLPIEFTQSFMQLVTESDEEIIFFTEKTATPILLNKPFLVAATQGFHAALCASGFELYTELFDYSFDDEKDIELRYEGIIENVKRIASMSDSELKIAHKQIFEKLVHNKKHAIDLIEHVPDEISDLLVTLKQKNINQDFGSLNILL